jgi:hypothetical protein
MREARGGAIKSEEGDKTRRDLGLWVLLSLMIF